MSLKTKIVYGAFWAAISTFGMRLLAPLATLVLAGLLTPADFGLIAIAQMVLAIAGVFHDIGLGQALIYQSDNAEKASSTAFFLIVGWSTLLYILVVIAAPWLAVFFNEPAVQPIIQLISVTLLISSIGTVPSALMEKNLKFKKTVLPQLLPIVLYIVLAVGLAVNGWGVWSIVWGRIGQSLLAVVLIWFASGWKLQFSFDKQIARSILNYGKHLLAASILTIVFLYIDNAYIGKLLGTEALGYYTFAFTLANLPTTSITAIVNRVAFPSYIKLRDNQPVLTNAYLYSIRLVSTIVFPLVLGLAVISADFLRVFYGDKWVQSIVPIQILSLYALFRSIGGLPSNILLTLGKQAIIPKLQFIYVMASIILLWPATHWFGIVGASFAMTGIIIVGATIWLLLANHYLAIPVKTFIKNLFPQIFASIFMACCVLLLSRVLAESMLNLVILVSSGAITYGGAILLITRGNGFKEILDIAKTLLSGKRTFQPDI